MLEVRGSGKKINCGLALVKRSTHWVPNNIIILRFLESNSLHCILYTIYALYVRRKRGVWGVATPWQNNGGVLLSKTPPEIQVK